MGFSAYVESGVLEYIFRGNDIFDQVDHETFYIGLASGLVDTSGTNIASVEFAGGSYGRVTITNDSTNWYEATGSYPAVVYNKTAFAFPTATADWGTATHWFIVDDASELISVGNIVPGKTISNGEDASFAVSGLYLTVS